MAEAPVLLASQPGIKRDGTRFEGDFYVDGRWCRFQRGKPRKMGGYMEVTDAVPEQARGMDSFSNNGVQFIHIGHELSLGQYQVADGTLNLFTARTPAALVTDVNNLWQFAVFADTAGGGTGNHLLIAHAAPNLANIDNNVGGNIYIGTVTDTALLDEVGLNTDPQVGWNTGVFGPVSGGVVVTGQWMFTFGSNGLIRQSQINSLSALPVEFNLGTQKIVKAFPLRGQGLGAAVIMWSLDSVIRGTATGLTDGADPNFQFDILSTETSILSSQGVVEYDGIFYWPGVDRFQLFNGVVREVPNNMNLNFFFDNMNFSARQKVFGFKVPRFGEIWWCFPKGSATECNHAVIFNVREGTWYDTALPDSNDVDQGRTAGVFAKVFQKPFMVDNEVTPTGRTLWQHEIGMDKVRGTEILAVPSFFETHELNLLAAGQAMKEVRVARIEPDFVQTGPMTLTVRGRQNAKAPQTEVTPASTFVETPTDGTDETIKLKDVKRLMSFKFESNVGGGDYEYGDTYAHIGPADGRVES